MIECLHKKNIPFIHCKKQTARVRTEDCKASMRAESASARLGQDYEASARATTRQDHLEGKHTLEHTQPTLEGKECGLKFPMYSPSNPTVPIHRDMFFHIPH